MKELERFLKGLISPRTRQDYGININKFLEFKGINTIEEFTSLTIDDIEDWSLSLKDDGNSQNTRRVKLAAIASFCDYLIERDLMNKNIVKPLIKKLKIDTKEQSYLTAGEVVKMLSKAKNKRTYAIMMVAVNTGIRVSELINLKLENYKTDRLEIVNGKGGKSRVVFLNETTKQALDDYILVRKESNYDNLFISDYSTPMQIGALNASLKTLVRKANVNKNISMHSLRRSLATDLYANGVDLIGISNILGHSAISNTQLYIKNQGAKTEQLMKNHSFNI